MHMGSRQLFWLDVVPNATPMGVWDGGAGWSWATCWISACGRNLTDAAALPHVTHDPGPTLCWGGGRGWRSVTCWTSGCGANLTPAAAARALCILIDKSTKFFQIKELLLLQSISQCVNYVKPMGNKRSKQSCLQNCQGCKAESKQHHLQKLSASQIIEIFWSYSASR